MNFEIWIAFVFAAMVLLIIPGPTILLVISQAITHGRRAVLPLVIGVTAGDFTAMVLSLLGLGAILASSAMLFSVLKGVGAAYLIYLGIRLWRSHPDIHDIKLPVARAAARSLFESAFVVTALNPKSIAFFIAFLPQFVRPQEKVFPQLLVLGSTFLFLAALNAAVYGLFAGHLRDAVQSTNARRWFNRCGGTALVGAGIITATLRRSS